MIPNIPEIKDKAKYGEFDIPREKLEYALAEALKKVDYCMECVGIRFPN